MSKRHQVIFVAGSSGAGKTTHCRLFTEKYYPNIVHIGAGKLIREFVKTWLGRADNPANQELAKNFDQKMKAGQLVDPIILWQKLILPALGRIGTDQIALIEGFPRDQSNLEVVKKDKQVEILGMVYLTISKEEAALRRQQQHKEEVRPEGEKAEAGREKYDTLILDVLRYFNSLKRLKVVDVSSRDIKRNQRTFADAIFYTVALATFDNQKTRRLNSSSSAKSIKKAPLSEEVVAVS